MAGRGPAPKPAHLRQRTNKKAGAAKLSLDTETLRGVPELPNPDGRQWHPLTEKWWQNVWKSPMASEYIDTDVDGLARLAILIDDFYKTLDSKLMQEIRLQEARFGLSPVDRSRLQWEIEKGEEAESKRQAKRAGARNPSPHPADPRGILGVVE